MSKENKKELIGKLEKIRVELTRIYMKLGNPKECSGDIRLKEDIEIFRKCQQ